MSASIVSLLSFPVRLRSEAAPGGFSPSNADDTVMSAGTRLWSHYADTDGEGCPIPGAARRRPATAYAQPLDAVLYNLAETCRILAVLLWPFIPSTASKIYAQLGLHGEPDKFEAAQWGGLAPGHPIGTPEPLFPRKDV